MMLFNRQIRSRLDLMVPNAAATTEKPDVCTKSLAEGTRVAARDYLDKEKWKYGHVDEKLGKLHYNIKLDDGRIWKRHIDQVREVGANLPARPELPTPRVEIDTVPATLRSDGPAQTPHTTMSSSVPAANPIAESQTRPQPSTSTSAVPRLNVPPAVSDPRPQIPAVSVEPNYQQSPRRSSRIIKPPRRLNL